MEDTQKTSETPAKDRPVRAEAPDKPSFWKRPVVIIIGTVLLAFALVFAVRTLIESFTHESTDDAFLDGDIVSIAPRVAGQVSKVFVNPNQDVQAGDPLLEIDPSDYEVQVAQKKSALAATQANEQVIKASLELLGTEVASAEATAKQSEAEAAASQAQADKANADLKRAEDLNQRKIISPQEYDTAKSAAVAADASLRASQQKAASDRAKVDTAKAQLVAGRKAWERAQAQSEQSQVDVQQAQLNLSYTRIVAPQAGRVTRKAVEAGDYVQVGQRLMALVQPELWVTANFKETQLKQIRVGQPVRIEIDSVAGHTFPGHVQSIQAGSGSAFSLLPPENAVGNFVKVVQRVPVRIFFDSKIDAAHVVGPGMSVAPSVHVTGFEVPRFVMVILAILLAAVAGLFWWRLARRKSVVR